MTDTPAVTANDLLTIAAEADQQAQHYHDLAARYRAAAAQIEAPAGLTTMQADVLAHLNGTPRRLSDLARATSRTQPAVASLLKGLIKAGRVRRVKYGIYERCH